jgi:hypothetical protein
VRADGISDFNPDSNLKITRNTDAQAKQQKQAETKKGCC